MGDSEKRGERERGEKDMERGREVGVVDKGWGQKYRAIGRGRDEKEKEKPQREEGVREGEREKQERKREEREEKRRRGERGKRE